MMPRLSLLSIVWLVGSIALADPVVPGFDPGPSPDTVPTIEDPALAEALRQQVFARRDDDVPLTLGELRTISRVESRGGDIASLVGLEHCDDLRLIDLAGNNIDDLGPIGKLDKLQSINISDNRVTDLAPLAGLKRLQHLEIERNQVTDLSPLAESAELRSLYAGDNSISDLTPLTGCPKLWSLDVSTNKVTSLDPLAGLSWLTTLNVANNQITDLTPLCRNDRWQLLILDGNSLSDLSPLVQHCQRDSEGERRFAPYLRLRIGDNPIPSDRLNRQSDELRQYGVKLMGPADAPAASD